jgi:hypothetical protein
VNHLGIGFIWALLGVCPRDADAPAIFIVVMGLQAKGKKGWPQITGSHTLDQIDNKPIFY